ncbi:MAG: FAD:protein FMN transferase [Lacipirellulaceae bacterium]
MGTTYSVKYRGPIEISEREVRQQVEEALAEVNNQMSTYLPDSELSQFNNSHSLEPQEVSPATAYVVQQAVAIHEKTRGALDVTVGPLVRLWKLNDPRSSALELSDQEIAKTRAMTGIEKVTVTTSPTTLSKKIPELEIDLSAIAKGYGVDRVCEVLTQLSLENFMVEIGGEVRTLGTKSAEADWRIGVESPQQARRELSWIVPLKDLALASSGDYRNFRGTGENAYTHILDPRTGRPLPYRGVAVTVVAETCLEADALATALVVMGENEGYLWCEEHDTAALFQTTDSKGAISERATPLFEKLNPRRPRQASTTSSVQN